MSTNPNQPSSEQREQIRHPISELPLFERLINDTLDHTEEQYATFREVKNRPHVLDDAIVERGIRAYEAQLEDVVLFERQMNWWQEEKLSPSQQSRVDELIINLSGIQERSEAVLTLLAEIKKGTIDRILEKDDFELGLEVLLRSINQSDRE